MRILVIGLDGATFDLINPWIKSGQLPVLKSLMDSGSHGTLMSTIPFLSPPAWTSLMTGKNPGKHGIFDFVGPKPNSYDVKLVNASNCKEKNIWEMLSQHGKRLCIINVPMTYPPREVNGILISGVDAPGVKSGITFPRDLMKEIEKEIGEYIIEPGIWGYYRRKRMDLAIEKALCSIENRFRVTSYLLKKEKWDASVVVFTESDRVQHFFWMFMDPEHPMYVDSEARKYGDSIMKVYRKLDEVIGRLLNFADRETVLMIISDHGAGRISHKTFCFNRWLHAEGFLKFKSSSAGTSSISARSRLSKYMQATLTALDFQVKKHLSRKTKEMLARLLPGAHEKMETRLRIPALDWQRTVAYADELRPMIRMNVKGREPEGIVQPGQQYENLRHEIMKRLAQVCDPETNRCVVDKIYRREDLYCGRCVDKAPDIIALLSDDYVTSRTDDMKGRSFLGVLSESEKLRRGNAEHRQNGIYIARGYPIKKNFIQNAANIVDIAPTILYLMNLPVPDDMDGKVLVDSIDDDYLCTHPVETIRSVQDDWVPEEEKVYTEEDAKEVRDRLRGLGYLE